MSSEESKTPGTGALRFTHAQLLVVTGQNRGISVPIDAGIIIGRDANCGLQIFDSSSSRRHFRVFPEGEGYFLEDLGSHNGTLVNGTRQAKTQLYHLDDIEAGGSAVRFICPACTNPLRTFVQLGSDPAIQGAIASTPPPVDRPAQDTPAEEAGTNEEKLLLAFQLAHEMARQDNSQELFAMLQRVLDRLIATERLALLRYDAKRRLLTPILQRRAETDPPGSKVMLDRKVIDQACANGRCATHKLASGGWLLVAPLEGPDQVLGVAYLELGPREQIGLDVTLLSAIARQAGLMLGQLDLLATIQHQKLRLEESGERAAEAAKEARVEKMMLSTVVNRMEDGILLINEKGLVTTANPAGRRFLETVCAHQEDRVESVGGIRVEHLLLLPGDEGMPVTLDIGSPATCRLTVFPIPLHIAGSPEMKPGLALVFRKIVAAPSP